MHHFSTECSRTTRARETGRKEGDVENAHGGAREGVLGHAVWDMSVGDGMTLGEREGALSMCQKSCLCLLVPAGT